MRRFATAAWNGTIKEGSGHLTTQSSILSKTQYSFNSRFAEGVGTNPEELLAAAHAGCFTMKLSSDLTQAGFTPGALETRSVITLDNGKITKSELILEAEVDGITWEEFQKIAHGAEQTCPVSGAFNFEISLTINLKSSIK
ncbi:OsmC family peroxiredoxin [Algoriphagus sp. D3-2-R+10]|uniref:OsmC family peroxiredoxin n=1 Tax=Algoriphagus aurantiacus TaxID=3103948 RepID=UPI002B388DE5|nr:OsmC family peroxiredoxin [Algoriphagus sp. D3-2-R+10]MEB2778673.1 OsmC family peroxiredoxin [Algoriphagus sp. D3-2-R+10]